MLGIWLNVTTKSDEPVEHVMAWHDDLFDAVQLTNKAYASVVCVFRKKHDAPFNTPFQTIYESACIETIVDRYSYIIDGQQTSGERLYALKKIRDVATRELAAELLFRRIPARLKRLLC